MPPLVIVVFDRSEKATRRWLGTGLDADMELHELLRSGQIRSDHVGVYLQSLRSRFPGAVVADMLCLLQIQLELSMQAKALLMAREAGLDLPVAEDARANLQELEFLQKGSSVNAIGRIKYRRFSTDFWLCFGFFQGWGQSDSDWGAGADGVPQNYLTGYYCSKETLTDTELKAVIGGLGVRADCRGIHGAFQSDQRAS